MSRCRVDVSIYHPLACSSRVRPASRPLAPVSRQRTSYPKRAAEPPPAYRKEEGPPARDAIHAVVRRDRDTYVAECLEIRVVTQGKTLDEVFSNLKEAITLYLEGEDLERLGLSPGRLVVTCELWFADGPGG